jgi:hypothetical protein
MPRSTRGARFRRSVFPWRSASTIADWPGNAPRALIMHADPLSAYAYRWLDPWPAAHDRSRVRSLLAAPAPA